MKSSFILVFRTKKTLEHGCCIICNLCIRKSNGVHELTPIHEKQNKQNFLNKNCHLILCMLKRMMLMIYPMKLFTLKFMMKEHILNNLLQLFK